MTETVAVDGALVGMDMVKWLVPSRHMVVFFTNFSRKICQNGSSEDDLFLSFTP